VDVGAPDTAAAVQSVPAGAEVDKALPPGTDDLRAAKARFDELLWFGRDPTQLRQLGRSLDAALPALLARGRINASDALLLKADLLDVIEPDPARRRVLLLRWWTDHPLAERPAHLQDARHADTLRIEQSVLMRWQSQPSEDRDVGELKEALEGVWAM
jgi:hypothetical protein